jgi:hypothetical protein
MGCLINKCAANMPLYLLILSILSQHGETESVSPWSQSVAFDNHEAIWHFGTIPLRNVLYSTATVLYVYSASHVPWSSRVVPPPGMGLAQNGVHSAAG